MKNNIYIITLLSLFLLNSCESFIDLQPLDKISTVDYWKTPKDLQNYMLQFYPAFFPANNMVLDVAYDSDDLITQSPSLILNGSRVLTSGGWRNEWAPIRNINIFFENFHKCESAFSSYQQYVGEAHFFRAWFYFNLLKKYGDLPWYSKVLGTDSEEELMRPRDPRTLIADSILVDLDKAILYLSKKATVGNCIINKEAALAFKTRVALYEGTWQKYHANSPFGTSGASPGKYFQECVEAAEELMNGTYSVGLYNTGNPDKDYFTLFGLDNMSNINEVLLYKAFNKADGLRSTLQGYVTYNANGYGLTWELVSSYLGKDGQPYNYLGLSQTTKGNAFLTKIANDCDPRLKSTIWIPGDLRAQITNTYFDKPTVNEGVGQLCPTGFQIKKSANPYSPAAGQSFEVGGETGCIIIRYAEAILNYAEAKCELDNTVANTQLNMLRTRVGMPEFTVNQQGLDFNRINYGYTISDELYEIRRERRVELSLEGFRMDDWMRWAAHAIFVDNRPKGYPLSKTEFPTFKNPLDANGLIDYYAPSLPNGYKFRVDQDYLYPIPQDELTLNPNLIQNPGW